MKISRNLLKQAVNEKIITTKQADSLFIFLKDKSSESASFNFTHILYYFGGLLAIGAMTLFMNLGWENFGGWGIFVLSILYALLGVGLTILLERKNLLVPAGICATFVVALTPLAIYGLQLAMGWWPDSSVYRDYHAYIQWHWLYMELGTLAVGVILIWIFGYPFMVMPIAVTLWYMSMDLASMLGQEEGILNFELRSLVSMYFGLANILLAFWVDLRSGPSKDYAFWLYIFGVLAFWGGLTWQDSDSELSKFLYLCINLLMIGIGVLLVRKVFVIFGALGAAMYFGHLAWQVFANSPFFPVILTAIGIFIIYLGTLWQKNEKWLTDKAQKILPKHMRDTLNARE
ncbi:membrane protein [Legionella adelaidensis]|uniref:Membrane protein n=1 Tax=Legionella adelaidensis TaxID=45056 RepID=A0A0W0R0V9_9GAMM|nr:DUF2157 domain-containing protein [Legionella adelaidensis]KTC64711.1 membrane protein [Legionella adelaidensis]